MAGNYKKADMQEECVQASLDAYELIKQLSGENDVQTCHCMLNLAQVYYHFERTEEARELYEKYLTMFRIQSSELEGSTVHAEAVTGGQSQGNWSEDPKHCKLRDVAKAAIDEIDGTGAAEEE